MPKPESHVALLAAVLAAGTAACGNDAASGEVADAGAPLEAAIAETQPGSNDCERPVFDQEKDQAWTCPQRTCAENSCIVSTTEEGTDNVFKRLEKNALFHAAGHTVEMGMYSTLPPSGAPKRPDGMRLGYDLHQECLSTGEAARSPA